MQFQVVITFDVADKAKAEAVFTSLQAAAPGDATTLLRGQAQPLDPKERDKRRERVRTLTAPSKKKIHKLSSKTKKKATAARTSKASGAKRASGSTPRSKAGKAKAKATTKAKTSSKAQADK